MRFRDFVYLMGAMTAVAWIAWVVVLVLIDPMSGGSLGFILFYLTLILSLIGTLTLLGTGVRVVFHKEELLSRQVSRSFRHSILLSVLITVSLWLFSWQLFTWWLLSLFILFLSLIELIFISLKGTHHSRKIREDENDQN